MDRVELDTERERRLSLCWVWLVDLFRRGEPLAYS